MRQEQPSQRAPQKKIGEKTKPIKNEKYTTLSNKHAINMIALRRQRHACRTNYHSLPSTLKSNNCVCNLSQEQCGDKSNYQSYADCTHAYKNDTSPQIMIRYYRDIDEPLNRAPPPDHYLGRPRTPARAAPDAKHSTTKATNHSTRKSTETKHMRT